MIKAINSYDLERKNIFLTYASRCIQNEILMFLRKNKKDLNNVSFNQPLYIDNDGHEFNYEDTLYDSTYDVIDDYLKEEEKVALRNSLKILSDRDREMVMLFFGFFNNRRYTQKELAEKYHINQSYVSRLIKKSINKLKEEILMHDNEKTLVR